MTKYLFLLCTLVILGSCEQSESSDSTSSQAQDDSTENSNQDLNNVEIDTTPRVTGIGGIFFFSTDVEKSKEWYINNLGLKTNPWGASFEFRNANDPSQINYLQWSPFSDGNEYFAPSEKEFMINYRVYNLEALVKKMEANGVTILDTMQTYDYGKFIHIMDNDGNKIELWEPVDSVFTAMGGPTTK